jgi:hypothetical protein
LGFLKNFYFSFPIQLLVMHIKKHQTLLAVWILLFLGAAGQFGQLYGIRYLFWDPEYMGSVNYLGFAIVGAAFGGFIMTWNITTYILESSHFQFLASFERPFAIYCLNNSLLPLSFVLTYLYFAVDFQNESDKLLAKDILMLIGGFLAGLLLIIFTSAIYFQTTNKNIFNLFNLRIKELKKIRRRVTLREDNRWDDVRSRDDEFRVDFYLTMSLGMRHIRSVKHYDEKMLRDVFRQNHMNAFIIEAITILVVFGLGFLIDYQFFRIPAVASGVLFLAILISLAGVIDFWFKSWKSLAFVMGIFLLNLIVLKFDLVTYSNKAYGLNYTVEPAEYSYASLDALASPENVYNDRKNTLDILNNWKAKTGLAKPKMVLLNFSGGGLGAATFALSMMQHLDSALTGKLMLNTAMMTGASGGMIGATYWRELYLRQLNGQINSMYDTMYVHNVSKDLLNITMATLVSNDIIYPLQTFKIAAQTYRKDRGYAFEKQLNENTDGAFTKPISAYRADEKSGLIPIMIYAPTIINDHRRLYISAQPVSYLSRPTGKDYRPRLTDVDGVDFQRMFGSQGADSLLVSSAVRMNATYPYILPYVTLPTKPVIKVMDAGLRDNFGLSVSAKFAYAFKDWINANTSGVVFVQIRQYKREREIEGYERETFITSLLSPISNIYANLTSVQDYEQTYLLNAVSEALGGNIELVTLEYNPQKKEEEASLSFHLTDKEKYDIIHTKNDPKIQEGIKRLQELLK